MGSACVLEFGQCVTDHRIIGPETLREECGYHTMNWIKASLILGVVSCAPPLDLNRETTQAPLLEADTTITPTATTIDNTDTVEQIEDEIKTVDVTEAPSMNIIVTTAPPPVQTTPALSGKERKALISHLSKDILGNVDQLVLTPRQKVAILQELEHQKLGLTPFTDPTPWQRLTREQQLEFNTKYLGLSLELQEYSRNQFLSLPDDRQAHAYAAFLSADLQTLSHAIEQELIREQQVLRKASELQRFSEQQRLVEQQLLAEQEQIAEQQHLAKQQQIAEQQQIAKQQQIAEQQHLAKQQQIAEQKRIEKQQQLAEQQRLIKQQQLHENQNLVEQQRIKEEQQAAIPETNMLVNDEHKRQQEINKLFDIITPQSPEKDHTRSQTNNDGKAKVKFQHFHHLKQNSATNEIKQQSTMIQSDIKFQHSKVEQIKQSNNPRRLGLVWTRQNLPDKQQETPASRELTRQQKRLNIRRLNFDPRRRQ